VSELTEWATAIRDQHDPHKQQNGYERCQLCGFTRHPCDTYELASEVLRLLGEQAMIKLSCGRCPICGDLSILEIDDPELAKRIMDWIREDSAERPFVQEAFPQLNADQREQLLTGAHGRCFDEAFGEED